MRNLIVVVLFLTVLFVAAPQTNADPLLFAARLDGPSEPTASPGVGFTFVTIDPTAHTMTIPFREID